MMTSIETLPIKRFKHTNLKQSVAFYAYKYQMSQQLDMRDFINEILTSLESIVGQATVEQAESNLKHVYSYQTIKKQLLAQLATLHPLDVFNHIKIKRELNQLSHSKSYYYILDNNTQLVPTHSDMAILTQLLKNIDTNITFQF